MLFRLGTGLLIAILGCFAQQRDLHVTPDRGRRLALVIGIDNYLHASKLRNAVNDANDLAAALASVGFSVDTVTNPGLRGMELAIDRFIGALAPGDVALFHFSGHGIQLDGENYLVPADFDARNEVDAKYDSYSASRIQEHLERSGSRLNIMILDACRNNSFGSRRSAGSGLAAMNAGRGTYVAFATAQGATADDNREGRNGLFTSRLLVNLVKPGLDLNEVFDRVRAEVYEASGKQQLPWTSSSVIGRFFFHTPAPAPAAAPAKTVDAEMQIELAYWNSIRNSSNPKAFESYLEQYTEGRFSSLAQIKLAELRGPPADPTSANPSPARTAPASTPPPITEPVPSEPARLTPEVEPARDPLPGTVQENLRDGLRYAWIPPGTSQIGCVPGDEECTAQETPRHPVRITRGFWLGQTEVTVASYARYAQAAGQSMPPAPEFNAGWQYPNHPIVRVTWDEASAYCAWAGGRLPTEAEWEYAARGGNPDAVARNHDPVAWYEKNSGGSTHDVATKQANPWGLHDMLGNVWEWCSDSYDPRYYQNSPASDPPGPGKGNQKVLRGGSMSVVPRFVRLSVRGRNRPDTRTDDYGFRCAGQSGP